MREVHYKTKQCEKCHKEFTPTSSTQKWCVQCLTKICEYCGEPFKVEKKSKFETTRFCSRSCQGKYRSERLIAEKSSNYKNGNRTKKHFLCDNCGEISLKEQQYLNKFKHHFCSRACQINFYQNEINKVKGEQSPKYSKKDVICEQCGKMFKIYASIAEKTRFCSMQCRNDWQSDMMKGDNHYNWQGGKTADRQLDMASREYKQWRTSVFERDKYTCQTCGDKKGGNLRAHHLKGYSKFPRLRHEISNGITLCEECHKKVHSGLLELDIQSELTK